MKVKELLEKMCNEDYIALRLELDGIMLTTDLTRIKYIKENEIIQNGQVTMIDSNYDCDSQFSYVVITFKLEEGKRNVGNELFEEGNPK